MLYHGTVHVKTLAAEEKREPANVNLKLKIIGIFQILILLKKIIVLLYF